MSVQAKATTVLREVEGKLRHLAAVGASGGDYVGTITVAAWAKAISDLLKSPAPRADSECPRGVRGGGRVAEKVVHRPTARKEYPEFFRRGDQLIRVAWSKRAKKEYQHKAPHSALKTLAATFAEAGRGGRVFATDQVLPIRDSTDGSEIPDYQSYVCIAWLKQTGLIDQHGRQGYSVPRLAEFQEAVESIWQALPKQ